MSNNKRRRSVRFDPTAPPEESKEEAEGPLIEEKTAEAAEEHGGRREQFREIAQRRAAHFARAEKATSSTPTGSLRSAAGTAGGESAAERASWPGPFSTAREILAQRESESAQATDSLEDEEIDEYDRELRTMQWTPSLDDTHSHTQTHTLSVDHSVPSLAELCLSLLTRFFDAVEGWEVLSAEQRERVAALLSREKRLSHEALLALAVPGADSLLLTDASQIDDNTLILAIEKMCGRVVSIEEEEGEERQRDRERAKKAKREQDSEDEVVVHNEFNHLVRLHLHYAGRCFTDRAAAALVNHAQRLLSLSLTGCYQLTDDALVRVLSSCAQTLIALDLSCDNRLSVRALACIAGLPRLQSLSLNHVSHLTDNDFSRSLLTESSDGSDDIVLPSLQSLSLDGLGELSDDCLSRLVRRFGGRLQSLSLSETSASDAVLMAIREACISLRSLSLCRLNNVTSAGLLALFVNDPEESASDSSLSSSSFSSHATRMRAIGLVEEVSFDGTINVTDDVVQQLCEQFGRSLRRLSLHGCHRLTDRSLVAIRWHCPQLEFLDLSFVRRVTEPALGLLVDHCLTLSELHLFGCTQFTDRLYKGQRARQTLKIVGRFSI